MTAMVSHSIESAMKPGGRRRAFADGVYPPPWMKDALCARIGGDAWFPKKGGSNQDAKAVCQRCPVREACLEFALEHGEKTGIWGGMSERERRKLAPPVVTCICIYCGHLFQAATTKAKYCSRTCTAKARDVRDRGTCIDCGGPTSNTKHVRCHDCSSAHNASTLYARGHAAA